MSVAGMTEDSLAPVAESASRKAALWIVAVFILGAALGGIGGYFFGHRVSAAGPQLSEEVRRHQKVAQLTQVLGLTGEQQGQIDVIFSETATQFQGIHKESDAQIEIARQKARERIRAVLTPDQLPKFEDFLRKLDADRKAHPPQH
jgi:hypothetical protein